MILDEPELYLGYTKKERWRKVYVQGLKVYERERLRSNKRKMWIEAGGGAVNARVLSGFATQDRAGFSNDEAALEFARRLFSTRERLYGFLSLKLHPRYIEDPEAPSLDPQPIEIWGSDTTQSSSEYTALRSEFSAEPNQFGDDISETLAPGTRVAVVARIKRDQALVSVAKRLANYCCQVCHAKGEWVTDAGLPYVEAHHIIPLGDGGFDVDANLIVVCAGCHRRLHYATDRRTLAAKLRHDRDI